MDLYIIGVCHVVPAESPEWIDLEGVAVGTEYPIDAYAELPIVVNLNVKIEHEVRIKVEKDVEELFDENPDLF